MLPPDSEEGAGEWKVLRGVGFVRTTFFLLLRKEIARVGQYSSS